MCLIRNEIVLHVIILTAKCKYVIKSIEVEVPDNLAALVDVIAYKGSSIIHLFGYIYTNFRKCFMFI